jgi:dTDP-4-dehydrorhamnose reductase
VTGVVADVAPSVVVNASSGGADWPVTAEGSLRVAMAAAETGVRLPAPHSVVVRTSLIIGDASTRSVHEQHVHDLVAGVLAGVLFTDVVRCPVHVFREG